MSRLELTIEDLGSIWLDDSVGAILQALTDEDILSNTLIIFQQDHGVETKMALYENGNRIAQFIHYPDWIPARTKYDIPVSTIDIAATLLDFAEVDESPYPMDGISWKNDILTGQNDYGRCLFFEMEKDRSVRCGCDKYLTIYEQDTAISTTYQRSIRFDYSGDLTNLFDLCGGTDAYITDSGDNQEGADLNLVDDFPVTAEDMAKVLQCHLDRTSHSADPGNITMCDLNPLTDSPTSGPVTESPTSGICADSTFFIEYEMDTSFPCDFVSGFAPCLCDDPKVSSHCSLSCGSCSEYACVDSTADFMTSEGNGNCALFSTFSPGLIQRYCEFNYVRNTCRGTCGVCN